MSKDSRRLTCTGAPMVPPVYSAQSLSLLQPCRIRLTTGGDQTEPSILGVIGRLLTILRYSVRTSIGESPFKRIECLCVLYLCGVTVSAVVGDKEVHVPVVCGLAVTYLSGKAHVAAAWGA